MPWLQIRIPTLPEHTEMLEDALLIAGCQAVTLLDSKDQPVFEPIRGTTPLWQQTTVQGLFEEDVDTPQLLEQISTVIKENQLQTGTITTEILEDKDWEREWMSNFKPIQCGEKLWIVPSWTDAPDTNAVNLKLDPGLAFGTGTHPTTFLCLEWLDKNVNGGESVLDYGCGSGILGLAAILLGSARMDGLDIDPQALIATKNNAQANGINDDQYRVTTEPGELDAQYDIVVANILAGPLCDLSESICRHLKPNAPIVLSGILAHQAETVMQAYQPWINFDPVAEKEGWIRLSGSRK
ncbi:50S ribosomal protein L11 methyltransferase [Reinekea marinisedimentorum]|uniref:Ribosomal protein L11 methyltransferase n=1 Tax=Reinekea marinisedimentorum TaxID=230495 RepID=A0A4R3I7I3_9GAMM|nr:50S ribosomal protein L11 methyltransferase [Reinekea marinisedimentorum]TCS41740.1 ribosomal protein L11 methyltransferase [Reinekea marinisedimentorum]